MNKKTIKSEETNNMKKVKLATLATLGAFTFSTTLSPALVEQASAKESVKDIWDNTGETTNPEEKDYEGGVTTEGEDEIVDIDKILEEINGGGNSEPVIEEEKDIWDNTGETTNPEEKDYEGGVVGDGEDETVVIPPTIPTEPVEPETPVEDEVEEPTTPTEPSEPVEEDAKTEDEKDIWDNTGESKEPEEEDYEGGVDGDGEDETVVIPPTVPTQPEDDKGKDNVKPTPKPEDNKGKDDVTKPSDKDKGKDNVTKPTPKPESDKGKDNVKPTPKPTKKTYTVKRGDTLYAIAQAHGTTVPKLAKDNGIKNVNFLPIGQKLVINGKVTTPKAPVNNANKGGNGTVNTKVVHTVKRGDTLYSIAKSYGTTINTLAKDNKIKNVNFIKVGQKIVVNGKAPVNNTNVNKGVTATYVVKKGDNLTKIAKQYGTTVNKIVKDNNIANKNLIFENQKLIIKK